MSKEWSVEQKRALVEALLACQTIQLNHGLEDVIGQLPPAIRNGIQRRDKLIADVANLVERCLSFEGGLQKLLEALAFFEADSEPYQRVKRLVAETAIQENITPDKTGANVGRTRAKGWEKILHLLRDPLWQFVGIVVAVVGIVIAYKTWQSPVIPPSLNLTATINPSSATLPPTLSITMWAPKFTPIQTAGQSIPSTSTIAPNRSSPATFTSEALEAALSPDLATQVSTQNITVTDTPMIALTPPATIMPVTPIYFNDMIIACRENKFTQDGSITPTTCASGERPHGLQLAWRVLTKGSYAGCSFPVPPVDQVSGTANNTFAFWLDGEPGYKFLIGFTTPENPNGWKVIVEVKESGWHQQVIPLSHFTDQGMDLAKIEWLVIAFEYTLGEGALTGTLCFDEFGFGQQ